MAPSTGPRDRAIGGSGRQRAEARRQRGRRIRRAIAARSTGGGVRAAPRRPSPRATSVYARHGAKAWTTFEDRRRKQRDDRKRARPAGGTFRQAPILARFVRRNSRISRRSLQRNIHASHPLASAPLTRPRRRAYGLGEPGGVHRTSIGRLRRCACSPPHALARCAPEVAVPRPEHAVSPASSSPQARRGDKKQSQPSGSGQEAVQFPMRRVCSPKGFS